MLGKATIAATVLGLAVAQVVLPSLLDLVITLSIAGGSAWAGFQAGRSTSWAPLLTSYTRPGIVCLFLEKMK